MILGLTGGSGAGKSVAAACFARLGAGIVDADAVYRTLCAAHGPMIDALCAAFGDVWCAEHGLNRPKLAQIVFSDAQKLQQLNDITTPYIAQAARAQFDAYAAQGRQVVLYDAPTLFQTGGDRICDAVIGVVAARGVRIARIMQRDGIPEQAAAARIDAQPEEEFYRARCQYILENNTTPQALEAAAVQLWNGLQIQNAGRQGMECAHSGQTE